MNPQFKNDQKIALMAKKGGLSFLSSTFFVVIEFPLFLHQSCSISFFLVDYHLHGNLIELL